MGVVPGVWRVCGEDDESEVVLEHVVAVQEVRHEPDEHEEEDNTPATTQVAGHALLSHRSSS